jgi:hypothetical protein
VTRRTCRILAILIAGVATALGTAALLDQPAAAAPPGVHCKHKPCDPIPSPDPTGDTTSPPPSGQVQGVSVPTATPFDDTQATPGPVVGTLITPQASVAAPVAAPALIAHPQAEPGLAALLIAAMALAALTVGAITVALALR